MPLLQQYGLALLFYIIFSLFAFVGLPVTLRLFDSKLVSYGTSKLLGLSVFGLFIWLLASFKILDYQNTTAIYILLTLTILTAIIFIRQLKIKWPWKSLVTFEVISLFLYFLYLYLRSLNPSANGTERFMDMMLLTATSKSHYFPFMDSWYAGKNINYYYYGQFLLGLIARLGNIPYSIAYNFCLGLLYSTATVLAGLFVYQITKSKWFAVLGGFLVTTAGNMFYASCVIRTSLAGQAACTYATSTRLYTPSYIINEIPSYSFTVGDLHAHFIALPFFLLCLFLIFKAFQSEKPDWLMFTAATISFATSALVNPTDAVSLGFLLAIVILYKLAINYQKPIKQIIIDGKNWIIFGVGLIISVFILTLPFTANFVTPVTGIGFSPAYAAAHGFWGTQYQYPTPFWAQVGMWGVYLITLIVFFWVCCRLYKSSVRGVAKAKEPKKIDQLLERLGVDRENIASAIFFFLILIACICILIGIELFFVKDIYHIANPPYFRANTTFKFGYHVWTLLSLGFAVCCFFFLKILKKSYRFWLSIFIFIFIFFSLFYPYQAIQQFYLAGNTSQPTLDDLQFMKDQHPDDYAVVQYIDSLNSRPIVVEAAGDSYSYYARISAFSGSIAPIGWKTHEWTWRFQGKAADKAAPGTNMETGYGPIALVAQDVQTIYESPDALLTGELLKKYNAEYVYIGAQERQAYPNLDEAKFHQLGTLVFSADGGELFKLN